MGANPQRRVLVASLAGTTIEFFDFYIYATAAVLVFPQQFFPTSDPLSARLQSLATFALAFFARPVGSAVFGHYGDRIGRKATLVASLLTMGLSTVAIGLLPSYQRIGVAAPALLALFRFGQGFGLGGEWGGAVLLATENAPPGRRAWYGMFPQLGAPIGLICSTGVFLLLTQALDDAAFQSWGWRVPFVASAVLVMVGLYVRLRISETPAFRQVLERNERVNVPVATVLRAHWRELLIGTFAAATVFVLFYLLTVFLLGWSTTRLGVARQQYLLLQMIAVMTFGVTIIWSARQADRAGWQRGSRVVMITATIGTAFYGLAFSPLLGSGTPLPLFIGLGLGFLLIGWAYGPLGTALAGLFPAPVRYTGASLAFNFAGIVGASLTPYAATWLASRHGLGAVGAYLTVASLVTLAALLLMGRLPSQSVPES